MNIVSRFFRRVSSRFTGCKVRRGFSLVELLVVVGIIMLVAASSLLVLDQTDDQVRYEKTRSEYKVLKTALFGPDMMTTIGGNLVISGYLADTGRLPNSLDDLLRPPAGMQVWGPIISREAVPTAGNLRLQHGWRGPYISETEGRKNDAWGNEWRYFRSDVHILEEGLRYRPGYSSPKIIPPALELGSYGKNGLPDSGLPEGELPGDAVVDMYDKDFPDAGILIGPEHFTLQEVPIPQRTLEKQSADTRTYVVGVIYPGLNMRESFGTYPNVPQTNLGNHPSLLRYPNGSVVTVNVPGNGKSDIVAPTGSDKDKDKDKDKSSGRNTKTLEPGLYFNLGYARQLQLALYDPNQGNDVLFQKLVIIDPVVITYYPKVSSSGTEAVIQNSGAGLWLIP